VTITGGTTMEQLQAGRCLVHVDHGRCGAPATHRVGPFPGAYDDVLKINKLPVCCKHAVHYHACIGGTDDNPPYPSCTYCKAEHQHRCPCGRE